MLSNVLTSSDLYHIDELQVYSPGVCGLSKDELHFEDQLNCSITNDSGILSDFDSWLGEATCITNLDASLQPSFDEPEPLDNVADVLAELEAAIEPVLELPIGSFDEQAEFLMQEHKVSYAQTSTRASSPPQAPSSPIEMSRIKPSLSPQPVIKYVQASTIDVSGLSSQSQIVMDDLNVLHLPESREDQATMSLLEALAQHVMSGELTVTEVECLLSSPPSSPEALVPVGNVELLESEDDEYEPPCKRGKAGSANSRSLKALKPIERKERKKVQNKNAATKYRRKKRAEDECAREEFAELEAKNRNLKRRADEISSEIKYMKGLLNDVLKGKGLRIT